MDQFILNRARRMADGLGAEVDAVSKSLRGYRTMCHPLFLERLTVHFSDFGKPKMTIGQTFTYVTQGVNGFKGNTAMNFILQPFYLQEEEAENECRVIYPHVSTKTVVKDDELEESMSAHVRSWVQGSSQDGWVGLRRLAEADLGTSTVDDLFFDFKNSSFSQQLMTFLRSNNWSFPAFAAPSYKGRIIHDDLVMKTKYYPARDDNRAYCQDSNRLRQLVGACLNRLVLPKGMGIRRRLHSSRIVRSDKKDILNLHIPLATKPDEVCYLVKGDISNFTGSLGNSWLMLYCMALDTQTSLRYKYNLYGIGDIVMMACWHEILVLYLYLTVHYPCYVEDIDEYHTLPGGYLGVNANITTGLTCLSLIMTHLCHIVRGTNVNIHAQAGGDDFAFIMRGKRHNVECAILSIRSAMNSYVGVLKEFETIELDTLDEGVIPDSTFCKKRICHEIRDGTHYLRGEESCPIHSSILPCSVPLSFTEQVSAWSELDLGLQQYEDLYPHMFKVANCFRRAFLEKYPYIKPIRMRVERICTQAKMLHLEGYILTETAFQLVSSIEVRERSSFICFQTFTSKLRHALNVGLVIQRDILYRGKKESLTLGSSEEGVLGTTRTSEPVCVVVDKVVLKSLLNILRP